MSVTRQWKIQIVVDGIGDAIFVELSAQQAATEGRHDLDITECRNVELGLAGLENSSYLARGFRL